MTRMGDALSRCTIGKIRKAWDYCNANGVDANEFCFSDGQGQWHSPLLALFARDTKQGAATALSLLEKGPDFLPWNLAMQESVLIMDRPQGMFLARVPFHLSAVLMMALSVAGRNKPDKSQESARESMERFLAALEGWPAMDWNAQAGGRSVVTLLAEHAPFATLAGMWPLLEKVGVSPLNSVSQGPDPASILQDRIAALGVKGKKDNVHPANALIAQWRAMRLEDRLPGPSAPATPAPRM